MLSPHLLDNPERVRERLLAPYAVFEDALLPDVAEALYEELSSFEGWNYQDQKSLSPEQVAYQEIHAPGYTFSRHTLQFGIDRLPPLLQSLQDYLVSEPVRQWMAAVSGRRCDDFEGGAAMLLEGGHIADHNDYGIFRLANGATVTRALTFNYYLTRRWNPAWGGAFVWKKPYARILPDFNTLVMFRVSQSSSHLVEAVSPNAGEKRLAITGWYRTIRAPVRLGLSDKQ